MSVLWNVLEFNKKLMEKNKNLVGEEFGRECYHLKTFLVQHTSRPTDASSTVDDAGSLF